MNRSLQIRVTVVVFGGSCSDLGAELEVERALYSLQKDRNKLDQNQDVASSFLKSLDQQKLGQAYKSL